MRLEPIILELEREQKDLLIIAHESVLRVLYGYLMACNAADIPFLEFPRDEIIEVRYFLSNFLSYPPWLTLFFIRLSLKVTRMRHEESIFPISPKRSSLVRRKTSRSQSLLVVSIPPCPGEDWAAPKKDLQHHRVGPELHASLKGSQNNMSRMSFRRSSEE